VGANPALTIAAFADRMCTHILESRAPVIPVTATTCGPGDPPCTSLSFVEEMRGFLGVGLSDPRSREGTPEGGRFAFRSTITADDVNRFLSDPEHCARAEGWIDAAVCGGRRPIARGWFNLFAPGDTPDRREMRYRLHFTDDQNRPRTLTGWKDVHHGPPTRLWLDTSTLFARLLEGHVAEDEDDDARVLAAGTLRILPSDLAKMLTTFRTEGPDGAAALARFGGFFLGELWEVYRPRHGS
jgi:cholesterol oxidase